MKTQGYQFQSLWRWTSCTRVHQQHTPPISLWQVVLDTPPIARPSLSLIITHPFSSGRRPCTRDLPTVHPESILKEGPLHCCWQWQSIGTFVAVILSSVVSSALFSRPQSSWYPPQPSISNPARSISCYQWYPHWLPCPNQ